VGELWLDGEIPVWHELPTRARADSLAHPPKGSRAHPPKGAASPPSRTVPGEDARACDDSVPELARRLAAYFAGTPDSFADVQLDLEWCTPFQRAVAETLRRVPFGETVTYGELAALAGYPNAQRAAGTFCAHNRLPLIVPCHRVVAAGGLGSYGSLGVDYKRRLLELEGAAL
jgi:methylated-DNA-[protein]-cysteine S-methyltransferase